jgi:hypothetical protein
MACSGANNSPTSESAAITAESHALVLFWPAASKVFSSLVKDDPDAAAKLKAYHDKEGIVFVQVIDLENGKVQSTTALDTGKNSFRIESIKLAGSHLIIADSQNRVSVYSLEGKRLASVPGRSFCFSSDRLLVDEDAQSERLSLYDLSTFEKRAEYVLLVVGCEPTPLDGVACSKSSGFPAFCRAARY